MADDCGAPIVACVPEVLTSCAIDSPLLLAGTRNGGLGNVTASMDHCSTYVYKSSY